MITNNVFVRVVE